MKNGRKNKENDKFKVWPELSGLFPANPRRVRGRGRYGCVRLVNTFIVIYSTSKMVKK